MGDESVLFEGRKLYFYNEETMIVVRSESSFPRGFMTDPNYRGMENAGNATLNWLTRAVFEGMVGVRRMFAKKLN